MDCVVWDTVHADTNQYAPVSNEMRQDHTLSRFHFWNICPRDLPYIAIKQGA